MAGPSLTIFFLGLLFFCAISEASKCSVKGKLLLNLLWIKVVGMPRNDKFHSWFSMLYIVCASSGHFLIYSVL